jgi:hypothetical protein
MRFLAAIVPCPIPTNLLKTINHSSIVHAVLETVFNVFFHGAGCVSESDSVQMLFGKSRFTCPRARGVYGRIDILLKGAHTPAFLSLHV